MVAERVNPSSTGSTGRPMTAVARLDVTTWAGHYVHRHAGEAGVDSLSVYLQEAGRYPLPTREEEQAWARIIQDASRPRAEREAAVQALCCGHLRWVVRLARGYWRYHLPIGDLISAGNEGLLHAAWKFDGSHRFTTYATSWILVKMDRFCADQACGTAFPWYLWPVMVRARAAYLRQHTWTVEALAAEIDATPEQVEALWPWLQHVRLLSELIAPDGSEDDTDSIGDFVADVAPHADPSSVAEGLQELTTTPVLRYLLDPARSRKTRSPLTWRERRILAMKYHVRVPLAWILPPRAEHAGMTPQQVRAQEEIALAWLASLSGGDEDEDGPTVPAQPLTNDVVAAVLGVSRERVRQTIDHALGKLRELVGRLGMTAEEVL